MQSPRHARQTGSVHRSDPRRDHQASAKPMVPQCEYRRCNGILTQITPIQRPNRRICRQSGLQFVHIGNLIFMTYCLAIQLDEGLVFCSDSRTNAGADRLSTFSKMHRFEVAEDRQLVLLSVGIWQPPRPSWTRFLVILRTVRNAPWRPFRTSPPAPTTLG